MKFLLSLAASLLFAMGIAGTTQAASIDDRFDPYVTPNENHAVPSMPTESSQRLADHYDPYILYNQIEVTEGCTNPAMELIADVHGTFYTLAELKTAEMNNRC